MLSWDRIYFKFNPPSLLLQGILAATCNNQHLTHTYTIYDCQPVCPPAKWRLSVSDPLKITRKRRNVCKSILNLSIYVSCIWSMCAPAWCVPHRPDKCTKLKILLLNGSLAEKRSSPKWWMMPWHSLALTHTQTHTLTDSHTLTWHPNRQGDEWNGWVTFCAALRKVY